MTRSEVDEWREHNRTMAGYYEDMDEEEKAEFDEDFDRMLKDYLEEHGETIEEDMGERDNPDNVSDDVLSEDEDLRAKLSREINEEVDAKKERKDSRQEFQQKYNKEDVEKLKESNPEQYERMKAVNKMATNEELDEAQGGETCWDSMTTKEKFEMQKTNPDRANALLQDYQDRHPGGCDEKDQTDDMKRMSRERQAEHREQREAEIPDDMRDSKNPYKDVMEQQENRDARDR